MTDQKQFDNEEDPKLLAQARLLFDEYEDAEADRSADLEYLSEESKLKSLSYVSFPVVFTPPYDRRKIASNR